MRLPDAARADILEFIGATPVAEAHLSDMIDALAERFNTDRRTSRIEPT
jgi:hypothetical protein